jgi:hypothetical protein
LVIAKTSRILEAFRDSAVTSYERARPPGEIGVLSCPVFRSLERRGILRDAGQGRYYLDEVAREEDERRTGRAGLVVLAITGLLILVLVIVAVIRSL